ncbi:MAG: P1 family peptidase [Thermoleophilia bacterium]
MTPWPQGFLVGHHTDVEGATGCTVILPPQGTVAVMDVRGGGASTMHTELLAVESPFAGITALLFTGGSALGLAAVDGVVDWCAEHGLGYDVAVTRVPIVPAAVIFDLGIGGGPRRPGPEAGRAACEAAVETPPARGSVGAGTGATVGKLFGQAGWCKGGVGLASATGRDGVTTAVLVVVNAFGDVLDETNQVLAGAWRDGEGFVDARRAVTEIIPAHPRIPDITNTTLAVAMTDAALTKPEAAQVARMVSSGVARAVVPVHTPIDGDVSFTLAGGQRPTSAFAVGMVAATLTETAIRDAVRSATAVRGVPTGADRRG